MKENLTKKKAWTTLSKNVEYKNKFFNITHEKFLTPVKTIGDYFVMQDNNNSNRSVLIVPVDEKEIIFIKQYRYPIKDHTVELPGGCAAKTHTCLQAAKDEMREEIGYIAKTWEEVGSFYQYVSKTKKKCTVYVARDLTFTKRHLEDTEQGSKVLHISIQETYAKLDNGKIDEAQSATALAFARNAILKK